MSLFATPQTLLYFKLGGAVLAGLGAGIKVFKEIIKKRTVPPKGARHAIEEPRSLIWESVELGFIAVGLIVNLTATALDQYNTNARNEAAATNTSHQLQSAQEQIRLAQRTLHHLERIATKIDHVDVTATFLIGTDDYSLEKAAAELQHRLQILSDQAGAASELTNSTDTVHSENVVGNCISSDGSVFMRTIYNMA